VLDLRDGEWSCHQRQQCRAIRSGCGQTGFDQGALSLTMPTVQACSAGGSTSCDGSSSNVCVQTGIQLSNTASGGAGVCGIAVSFQYPFQFWLPFTSLNKQQIWLTATAHARVEAQ